MASVLLISNSVEFIRLRPMDIVCVEADRNYSNFTLLGGEKRLATVQLGQVEEMMGKQLGTDAALFIRVGRGVIVNREYIYYISHKKQQLILRDEQGHSYPALQASVDSLHKLQNYLSEDLNKDEK